MTAITTRDLIAILPELILVLAACLVLVVEPFLRQDKTAAVAIALTALLASGVVAVGLAGREQAAFSQMIVLNEYAVFFKVLFAAAGALTVLMSPRYLEANGRHLGEYYVLLLFAVVGMDIMAAARDLIAFYVGLELMAVSSYLLAGFMRYQARSNEAALKYFITGAFASAITLYGISLIYGYTGATNYEQVGAALTAGGATTGVALATALVLVGMGFKVSVAPFHMWTPDVYQGAPTPVAAFFSVGPKAAGFAAILMVFVTALDVASSTWSVLFIVLAVLTMFVGNAFALAQKNVKRMLAYSSIAHVGYLLAGLGALGHSGDYLAGEAILFYLAAYTFMNLGAFGILAYLKTQQPATFGYSLGEFAGLARRSPWAAVLMALFMFSLTGIPGTAGFVGKFYLFNAVVRADLAWLAVIAVLFSAVSAYYYLRVIMYMFFREPEMEYETRESIGGPLAASLALSAVGVLVIGLLPSWVWDAASGTFGNLFG
ncbi:MAG: NADH-quinone oxidoreductase subunit N [Thermoleophilia bacterium]